MDRKKIIWARSKAPLQVDDEIVAPNNCKDEGKKGCGSTNDYLQLSMYQGNCDSSQPFALPLLPVLKVDQWCSNTSIFLSGTACTRSTGPPVGAVDIGVSKSAYYFCMALPGVKQDPGEFSFEVHRDGMVCVRGVASTGEKFVRKYSREFEMKFQQQCPPGPFTVTFKLPGPVDPRLVSPTFRADGIFEAVVAKCES